MHKYNKVSCALMTSALALSMFGTTACRRAPSSTEGTTALSTAVSSETDNGKEEPSDDTTDSTSETTDPRPMDPIEQQAKTLAAELGVTDEELHGKYDLFLKYADIVVNNPKLGEWRAYALHVFPILADHLTKENEEYFMGNLKDLLMKSLVLSDAAGEYIEQSNQIRIYGDGIVYETESTYTTAFHELIHFIDDTVDGKKTDDVYYTDTRFTYQDDYTDEEWAHASDYVDNCCDAAFITEGGAELFMGKYFSKTPRAYYCETSFLTGLEWIYGSETLDKIFFSHDSSMQFIRLLEDAGYSPEKICHLFDSFNFYTYQRIDMPEDPIRYEDVLIDLYTHVKDSNWKEDKVFYQILWQIHQGFSYQVEMKHTDVDFPDMWDFSKSLTSQVSQVNDADIMTILSVVLLDGKPYLTCGLYPVDDTKKLSSSALIIDYDFENKSIRSHELYSHAFPKKVPAASAPGDALDARLLSLKHDNTAAHQQTAYAGSSDLQASYERAAKIGNQYGMSIYLGENIPSYIDCSKAISESSHIRTALDHLEAVLADFPEDFFDQFNYGYYSGFEIVIADRPLWNELQVYSTDNGYRINICLDCRSDETLSTMKDILRDAIFSAVDLKLQNYFENLEEPQFSEEVWITKNPEGFTYYGYINDDFVKEEYELNKKYLVSFTSMRCAPKERSQLMAALLEGEELTEECLEKAQFYSACIREAFDDASWPENTVWEKRIEDQKSGSQEKAA